jgi:hypothetical protein
LPRGEPPNGFKMSEAKKLLGPNKATKEFQEIDDLAGAL